VSDVRLRLSHTIHNTEGGKRVHSVVSNTTRVVADTGKVVAGGIGAAKVSLSSVSFDSMGVYGLDMGLNHGPNIYKDTKS
jgi:hypothetical protein